MDRARPFEYVYRLPANTIEELKFREDVYDRQVLLNETWESYALRKNRLDELDVEHVKWITRTWDEDEKARSYQQTVLQGANAEGDRQIALHKEHLKCQQEKSAAVIASVMGFQRLLTSQRTLCRHNLFVDFDLLQQRLFLQSQYILFVEEQFLRFFAQECMEGLYIGFCIISECHRIFCLIKLNDRLRKEEEVRQQLAEQERLAVEEERRIKELRQKELEEAERIKKENMERAKILERKRREEERRAKSRLDRERLKHFSNNVAEVVPNELKLSSLVAFEEVLPVSGDVHTSTEIVANSFYEKSRIVYYSPEGNDISSLIQSAFNILSVVGDKFYIISVDRLLSTSTVVFEDGIFAGNANTKESSRLLNNTITEKNALSISSAKLHGNMVYSWEDYFSLRVEVVENSRIDDRCFLFDKSIEKQDESIIFLPLVFSGHEETSHIVGLSRSGANAFGSDEVKAASKVVWELSTLIDKYLQKERKAQICQQCMDWLNIVTGCENCYVSLKDKSGNFMTYVAASESHRFMIGKKHFLVEENNGHGISFHACDAAEFHGEPAMFLIDDISEEGCIPFENQKVKCFLGDCDKKTGSLSIATIGSKKANEKYTSAGLVFMDHVGTNKKFAISDCEILQLSAKILARLLLDDVQLSFLGGPLKIEEEVQNSISSRILFLKCLWRQTLDDLARITSGQLLELAKYIHPPPIISLVVQATLLVALGSKPKKVEKWADSRKKVSSFLLKRMSEFDPTDPKLRREAFFIRAGKIIKGYVAKDVFEKGSYPASCFFLWVFSAILMRKYADFLRGKGKQKIALVDIANSFFFSLLAGEETRVDDDSDINESGSDDEPEEDL